MDWQEILSLIIVAAVTVLILRLEIQKHKLRKRRICGGDCNCSPLKAMLLKQIETK